MTGLWVSSDERWDEETLYKELVTAEDWAEYEEEMLARERARNAARKPRKATKKDYEFSF